MPPTNGRGHKTRPRSIRRAPKGITVAQKDVERHVDSSPFAAERHRGELKLSFLLFDEIEKASDALWQLLLGILDRAILILGNNRRVDLSQII